jgi:predicted RNA binding protein YcfA (HicA-like mRNA interferase family)
MKKVTPELTIKLTIPLHGILDRGTLKSIIKSSGLTTEEFVELL